MGKVSVIVTTFNRPNLLKDTIKSILSQTYRNFELIIVDNKSEYDFFNLIKSFKDSRIKAFQNENNGIIAVNRNYGINKSTGKYIAFCDDDDLWLENKLETQLDQIEKKININSNFLVYTNTILFGKDIAHKKTKKKQIKRFEDFFQTNNITLSSVLLTKSDKVMFDIDPAKKASEDFDLWINLFLSKYTLLLLEDPLVKYRIISNSAFRQNYSYSYIRYLYVIYGAIIKYKLKNFNVFKLFYYSVIFLIKYLVRKLQGQ